MTRLIENVNLSSYTTLGVGGIANYFAICSSVNDIIKILNLADSLKQPVYILGGGSNIIFPDEGINGIVIKIDLKGITSISEGDYVIFSIGAGENWDNIVKLAIENSLGGIECLSGIPGSAGATPIQNVGAYGQEIKSTLISLKAIDRRNLEIVELDNNDCNLSYRQSRFKNEDKDNFIITEITLRLKRDEVEEIKYPELANHVEQFLNLIQSSTAAQKLKAIRKAVLDLRRKKSMIIDEKDMNSRSCGSFFMNPVLSENEFEIFKKKFSSISFPHYKTETGIKIPAAWLVEHAGFSKGFKRSGAGISANHSLAIINYGGTAKEILDLALEIENEVMKKFGIKLNKEPVVVQKNN